MAETNSEKRKYHHGNLAEALIAVGLDRAREGGPKAITLRHAAREVGVSAPAAYRHFANRDELVTRVSRLAAQLLGAVLLDAAEAEAGNSVARLRAVGQAYIDFALDQPGLLETAFVGGLDHELIESLDQAEAPVPSPFGVLVDCLELLVADGHIPPERREGAEIVAWSSVHGLAMLFNSAPPDREDAEETAARVLTGVQHALGIKDDETQ